MSQRLISRAAHLSTHWPKGSAVARIKGWTETETDNISRWILLHKDPLVKVHNLCGSVNHIILGFWPSVPVKDVGQLPFSLDLHCSRFSQAPMWHSEKKKSALWVPWSSTTVQNLVVAELLSVLDGPDVMWDAVIKHWLNSTIEKQNILTFFFQKSLL